MSGRKLTAALSVIINAHPALPIASAWGDGQFLRGGKRLYSGGNVNARYGVDPGFSSCTHVPPARPVSRQGHPAAAREAPYMIRAVYHM